MYMYIAVYIKLMCKLADIHYMNMNNIQKDIDHKIIFFLL